MADGDVANNEAVAYNDMADQLRELRKEADEREQLFVREQGVLQEELNRLQDSVEQRDNAVQEREQDLRQRNSEISELLVQIEADERFRKEFALKHDRLVQELESRTDALDVVTERELTQAAVLKDLRTEFEKVQSHNQALEAQQNQHTLHHEQMEDLLGQTRGELEQTRLRVTELTQQLNRSEEEGHEAKEALKEAARERDRLLRDHRAEADGDRAVLEHQFLETRRTLEATQRDLKKAQTENEALQADVSGMKEELQRATHELQHATQIENTLRAELSFANTASSLLEQKQERAEHALAQALDVAIAFRNSHAKALASAQAMLKPSATALGKASALAQSVSGALADSSMLPPIADSTGPTERPSSPTPIDPSDPAAALEILREYDLDAFAETISKTGTTIRKWQKQCKEYRERAKGRISFRNFQKGDLALFLPTRNSIAKPWAAFNSKWQCLYLFAY